MRAAHRAGSASSSATSALAPADFARAVDSFATNGAAANCPDARVAGGGAAAGAASARRRRGVLRTRLVRRRGRRGREVGERLRRDRRGSRRRDRHARRPTRRIRSSGRVGGGRTSRLARRAIVGRRLRDRRCRRRARHRDDRRRRCVRVRRHAAFDEVGPLARRLHGHEPGHHRHDEHGRDRPRPAPRTERRRRFPRPGVDGARRGGQDRGPHARVGPLVERRGCGAIARRRRASRVPRPVQRSSFVPATAVRDGSVHGAHAARSFCIA